MAGSSSGRFGTNEFFCQRPHWLFVTACLEDSLRQTTLAAAPLRLLAGVFVYLSTVEMAFDQAEGSLITFDAGGV